MKMQLSTLSTYTDLSQHHIAVLISGNVEYAANMFQY
jgi:hypothetical protein